MKLNNMIMLAAVKHNDQTDRAGKPYILHPLEVMRLLNTDDIDLQCIAVGHDLLEDTDVTEDQLREKFGDVVADAIVLLSKTEGMTQEEYEHRLISSGNIMAWKVKMADLQHNSCLSRLKGVRDKDIERMAKYQRLYYKLKCLVDGSEKQ